MPVRQNSKSNTESPVEVKLSENDVESVGIGSGNHSHRSPPIASRG